MNSNVAIVMATFNGASHVEEQIRSLQAQDFPDEDDQRIASDALQDATGDVRGNDLIARDEHYAGAGTLGRVAAGCTSRDDGARTASDLERELRILAPRAAFDAGLLERFGAETGVRVTQEQYAARADIPLPPDDAGFDLIDTANTYSTWVPGHTVGESETM